MALNDVYQLSLEFNQDGREWVVVEYYRISTDDAAKTVAEITLGLVQVWKTQFWDSVLENCVSDDVDFVALVGQKIHPTRDFQATNILVGVSCAVVSPPLPAHTCALIHQTGSISGRSFQGRVFISGVPTTFQAEGKINGVGGTAYLTHAVVAFGQNILAPIGGSPMVMTHVNFSKKLAAAMAPTFMSDIQAANTPPQLETQRNRTLTTKVFAP